VKKLLIVEAVPQYEAKRESLILGELIRMFNPRYRDDYVYECKSTFMDDLHRYFIDPKYGKKYGRFNFIHFSGHGKYYKRKGPVFNFPRGSMTVDDLPERCFKNTVVTFSACQTGSGNAIDRIIEKTKAKLVIAPDSSPYFENSAIWFLNYYYLVLKLKYDPIEAFEYVNDMMPQKLKHVFKMGCNKER
jgi:hypothetical protein